jgi:hypothetical protein
LPPRFSVRFVDFADRKSRSHFAAVSTAVFAASSQEIALVPITSVTQ